MCGEMALALEACIISQRKMMDIGHEGACKEKSQVLGRGKVDFALSVYERVVVGDTDIEPTY